MHQHLSACLSSFNLSVSAASTNRAVLAEYIESIFVSVQFSWSNLFYLCVGVAMPRRTQMEDLIVTVPKQHLETQPSALEPGLISSCVF